MADARKNRDKLMSMMAMSEEITRANNKIYSDLSALTNNPDMKDSLYSSIDDLIGKVNKLKSVELGTNFIEQEQVVLAPKSTIAPTEDPDYQAYADKQKRIEEQKNKREQRKQEALAKQQKKAEAITPEEEAHNEVLEEATNTPQPPVPPKRNVKKNTRKTRQRSKGKNFSNLGKGEEGTQKN